MSTQKQKRRNKRIAVICILLAALLAGLFFDINAGYASISLPEILEILAGGGSRGARFALLELRLPRVVTSLLVGIGLAVSGSIVQGITRNDMAEPGILGINAAAGMFIAIFVVFFTGTSQGYEYVLPLIAVAGSAAAAFIEYRLSLVHGKMSGKRLLLIGVALSSAFTSVTTMLMLRMSDSQYAFVQSFIAGSIWGASWKNAAILAVCLLSLSFAAWYHSRTLNVLVLNEESAAGLGVNIQKSSFWMLACAVAMSGLCCAVGGGLSFVGLVCPHLARRLVGPNYRYLFPVTLLCGAVLLVYSDIISRTLLLPNEIPIGIVAAVIGAPYFLYLLVKE